MLRDSKGAGRVGAAPASVSEGQRVPQLDQGPPKGQAALGSGPGRPACLSLFWRGGSQMWSSGLSDSSLLSAGVRSAPSALEGPLPCL